MLIIIQNAYLTSNRNEEFYKGESVSFHLFFLFSCSVWFRLTFNYTTKRKEKQEKNNDKNMTLGATDGCNCTKWMYFLIKI